MIDPDEKTDIKRNDTKRKRFRGKFFIVPAGTPLIPYSIAFFEQASIHFPHLLQKMEIFPSFISCLEIAYKGHTSTHLKHSVHLSFTTLTVKGVTLFERVLTAPSGQRKLHCVLFLDITGNTTTSPANNEINTPALAADSTDVTFSNSVTALNGHIQSQ